MIIHLAIWTAIFYVITRLVYAVLLTVPAFENQTKKRGDLFWYLFAVIVGAVLIGGLVTEMLTVDWQQANPAGH